jgi:hypothetical protein
MKTSKCAVFTDKNKNGVCICVVNFEDQKEVSQGSIVLTPAIARQIAHDILVEADKIDALGGPTEALKNICVPENRNASAS